ncbi:MAG: hypothetical protein LIQ30_11745, partial [Planctomycetes bacterium]|nr:hypothetical protein [Planctomycetota bacterium]
TVTCCRETSVLRCEDEVYSTLQAEMPSRGSICVTENFTGEVASADMFRQEIQLLLPDGSVELIHLSEIKEIQPRRKGGPMPGPGRGDNNRPSGRYRVGESSRRSGRMNSSDSRRQAPPAGPARSDGAAGEPKGGTDDRGEAEKNPE